MKKIPAVMLLTIGLLVVSSVALAQSRTQPANIPFAFVVNGVTLPPGNYTIELWHSILRVRNSSTGDAAIAPFHSVDRRSPSGYTNTKLLFALNNGRYVLHQVRLAGDRHAHDIVHGTEVPEPVLAD